MNGRHFPSPAHGISLLVVIHDFEVAGVSIFALKTDSPLAVDPKAVLPLAVSAQGLETGARNCRQIRKTSGGVQVVQSPLGNRSNIVKPAAEFPAENPFRLVGPERTDHRYII
jgi:hypothetical protein